MKINDYDYDYLSDDAFINDSSCAPFLISQEAEKAFKSGNSVCNASIGVLLNEKGSIYEFDSVKKAIEINSTISRTKDYPPIDGGEEFSNNCLKWIFKSKNEQIKGRYFVSTLATIGGTGAIRLAIKNYLNNNQEALLPSVSWNNYKNIILEMNKKFVLFDFFDQKGVFNVDGFLKKCDELVCHHNELFVILNDPCHNPTGYSLSKTEWGLIITNLNRLAKFNRVVLLVDIAYFDYSMKNDDIFIEYLANGKVDFLCLIAFSASKTMGIYGFRVGALIAVCKTELAIKKFREACLSTARSTWSCPNNFGIAVFNTILNSTFLRNSLIKEIGEVKLLLVSREKAIRKFLKGTGAEIISSNDGFFMVVRVKNSQLFCDEMKKRYFYFLPISNTLVRIAKCSFVVKRL